MDNVKIIEVKWEYRAERHLTIDGMNLLGQDGWELVGIYQEAANDIFPPGATCVFKRPIYPEFE